MPAKTGYRRSARSRKIHLPRRGRGAAPSPGAAQLGQALPPTATRSPQPPIPWSGAAGLSRHRHGLSQAVDRPRRPALRLPTSPQPPRGGPPGARTSAGRRSLFAITICPCPRTGRWNLLRGSRPEACAPFFNAGPSWRCPDAPADRDGKNASPITWLETAMEFDHNCAIANKRHLARPDHPVRCTMAPSVYRGMCWTRTWELSLVPPQATASSGRRTPLSCITTAAAFSRRRRNGRASATASSISCRNPTMPPRARAWASLV